MPTCPWARHWIIKYEVCKGLPWPWEGEGGHFTEVYHRGTGPTVIFVDGKGQDGKQRWCLRGTLFISVVLWAHLNKYNSKETLAIKIVRLSLVPLNKQMDNLFILLCIALVLSLLFLVPPSLHSLSPSLSRDCLHVRIVARGACEVIQSRNSPSHAASWYSHHTLAPWGSSPEYWLTEGDYRLSFQLSLLLAFFGSGYLCSLSSPFSAVST